MYSFSVLFYFDICAVEHEVNIEQHFLSGVRLPLLSNYHGKKYFTVKLVFLFLQSGDISSMFGCDMIRDTCPTSALSICNMLSSCDICHLYIVEDM